MNRGRAYRRHQDQRARAHAIRLWVKFWGYDGQDNDWDIYTYVRITTEDGILVCTIYEKYHKEDLYKNMQCCSCWMCGNPRKYFGGVTRQELKADLLEKDFGI